MLTEYSTVLSPVKPGTITKRGLVEVSLSPFDPSALGQTNQSRPSYPPSDKSKTSLSGVNLKKYFEAVSKTGKNRVCIMIVNENVQGL